jgi:phosphatidylcholine synthase
MKPSVPIVKDAAKAQVKKAPAWGVHLFTALSAVCGLMAVLAIMNGDWKLTMIWLVGAVAIDSLDGTLARKFKVQVVLPGFDGALLDNIVDYLTYVFVPALFVYAAGLVPEKMGLIGAAIILLSSAYQFCQADAKTDDYFFKGFPSYWNIVAFYMWLFAFDSRVNLAIIVLLATLVFVPVRYVYPTRTKFMQPVTIGLGFVWAAINLVLLIQAPEKVNRGLLWSTQLYTVYYVALSLYLMAKGHDDADENDPAPA